MGVRPAGRIPVLANDATYPALDGTKPWHSGVTKVDPGLSKESAGWQPQERIPAQYVNWLEHQLGAHLARLDAIEVQNWTPHLEIDGPNHIFYDATYEELEHRLYFAGRDTAADADIQWSTGGRYNFVSEASSLSAPPSQLNAICFLPDQEVTWTVGGTKGYAHISGNSDTWSGYAFSGVVEGTCLYYDKYLQCLWFGHTNTGPVPGISKITGQNGASRDPTTLNSAASYTSPITDFAAGPGRRLALMRHATAAMLWGSSGGDGTAAWTRFDTPAFLTENPLGLVYSDEDQLFMVVTANGKVYTNGIGASAATWTLAANLATVTPVGSLFSGGLLARGSLYIAGISVGGALQAIGHSRDQGATWDIQGPPMEVPILKILEMDHRPMVLSDEVGGATQVSYGLRLRW